MLIHLGGTRLLGVLLTMDAEQGVALARLVRPGLTVPIHYDDYRAFRSPLGDFLSAMTARDPALQVRAIRRGERVPLPTSPAR